MSVDAIRSRFPGSRPTACYDLTVFALVALPHSAPEPLVYRIPPGLEAFAAVGARVRVQVRDRELTGILVAVQASSDLDPTAVRPLIDVLDPAPLLPVELLGLARFITDYYRCPLGATLATMLPARLLRADSEMVLLTPSGVGADPSGLGAAGAAILSALVAGGSTRVPALLAKANAASCAVRLAVTPGWELRDGEEGRKGRAGHAVG